MFSRNAVYATSAGTGWRTVNTGGATAIRMYDDPGDPSIGFHLHASETAGTNLSAWDSTDIKMTIRVSGNVGIGYTAPGYKLAVNGDGYFSSHLTTAGNFTANGRYFINGGTTFGYKIAYNGVTLANGTVVSDSNAADGYAVYMDSTLSSTMFYGPYTSISNGEYVASFRMKVSDNSSTSALGQIDVIGTNTLGSTVIITPSMFETSDRYQYIDIPFTANGSNSGIEFRGCLLYTSPSPRDS